MAELTLTVKMGSQEHQVTLLLTSTVGQLKQQLAPSVGLLPRQQKLIFKGKVLEDAQTLSGCKLNDGSKLMLLAAQGAAQTTKLGTAAAAAKKPTAGDGAARTSSLLAQKMADMAKAQPASTGPPKGMSDRRAAWSKTGVIALRDLQLTSLEPCWLDGLGAVKAADVSHNRLQSLPSSVCQLTALSSLKLSHNCLQDSGMPWLQLCSALASSLNTLQLGHNQLQQLPACLGQLTALTSLDVQHNQLCCVEPGGVDSLVKLEELQLQGNRLQELPQGIGHCSNLVALNASHNALAALPDSITCLGKLQVLAVDANKLSALPVKLLSACSSLSTLCAHHNPLTVEDLRTAEGYAEFESRRQARASKQLGGRVMADTDRAFSEGADVEQWQRWATGPTGLGSDGTGRAGKK